MSYLEAAINVLETSPDPLTTSQIMEKIQSRGLIQITGKTPRATLAAALYRALGKHPRLKREAGEGSLPGKAKYGTVRWYLGD